MTLTNFIDVCNLLEKTAVIAVSEESDNVLGFNDCMKSIFPDIEINKPIPDILNAENVQISDKIDDDKTIILMNTPALQGYAQMSELQMDFEDCGKTRISLIEPASELNFRYEKINSIFSALFSKNKEVILFLYLDKMQYEYIHISELDDDFDVSGLRCWKNVIELLINEYSDEKNGEIISQNLGEKAILKAYEDGGESYSVKYSIFVDNETVVKNADIDFVEYSEEPIAVLTIKTLKS